MCQQDLMQVLRHLPRFNNPNLIFGYDTVGDAGVYKISDDIAIVQSVDLLTPIADDAFIFGEIAADNSLSDLYVMGAKPITALNIIGFPTKLDLTYLEKIIQGGSSKIEQAGAVILGGHTIKDEELKYGLAITGIIHPKKILTNENAQVGDKIILTKPIGTGIISTALKNNKASEEAVQKINDSMRELNNVAAETMMEFRINACTDVTGFGLLGHALQLAQASNVSLRLYCDEVPMFEEAFEYVELSLIPGGTIKNKSFVESNVQFYPSISETKRVLLCDAQTSGGLLISTPEEESVSVLQRLKERGIKNASIIGEVTKKQKKEIYVVH